MQKNDKNMNLSENTDKNDKFIFSPIMLGIIPLAAVLMFLYLGNKSFWLDEAFSYTIAKMDWAHFWFVLSHNEANQGLYYLLLHFWINIGQSEFAIRSLSVVFALCMVLATYIAGKNLFGKRVGIIAALLITVNTFFIAYAQEARAYMLALLLATLSSYFFIKAIEDSSWKKWGAYILFISLGVYAHIYVGLLLAAQIVSLVFLLHRGIPWKSLLISMAIILVLLLPMILFVLTKDMGQIGWVSKPALWDIPRVFNLLAGQGGPVLMAVYFIAGVLAVILILRTYVKNKMSLQTWKYTFLLIWLILPILFAFIFSFIKPIFVPRYFIIFLSPLVFLAAIGLSTINRRWILYSSLVVLMIFSAFSFRDLYTSNPNEDYTQKDDWRAVTTYIISASEQNDAIVFFKPFMRLPFEYYRERLKVSQSIPTPVSYLASAEDDLNLYYLPKSYSNVEVLPEPDRTILDRLNNYNRVWLVLGYDLSKETEIQGQTIQKFIQEKYDFTEEKDYYNNMRVFLYTLKVP